MLIEKSDVLRLLSGARINANTEGLSDGGSVEIVVQQLDLDNASISSSTIGKNAIEEGGKRTRCRWRGGCVHYRD